MKVVISGSFRKHLKDIMDLKNQLERDGMEVLKPIDSEVIDNLENPEFVKFIGEESKSEYELQREYDDAIFKCDAHIVCNIGGYIGKSAIREMIMGAGNNVFDKKEMQKGIFKNANSQVYLLEPWNKKGFEDEGDTKHFSTFLDYLIKTGSLKIGLEEMYKDFEIKDRITEMGFY
ncbi:MAG: hypothetical protein A2Y24_05950 [Clostridiales bacterium GWE2_32_10]|nr:MAG: hypothetical protein A2Y24_05950 [Clostridiales bacterium GWE2_32_10]